MIRVADIAAQAARVACPDEDRVVRAIKNVMATFVAQAASLTADVEHEMFLLIVVAVGTFADTTDDPIMIREMAVSLLNDEIADLRAAQKQKPKPEPS